SSLADVSSAFAARPPADAPIPTIAPGCGGASLSSWAVGGSASASTWGASFGFVIATPGVPLRASPSVRAHCQRGQRQATRQCSLHGSATLLTQMIQPAERAYARRVTL